MHLNHQEVHVWSTDLNITKEQENEKLVVLSPDEIARANRFHFAIHRSRFIAARSVLRELLSIYLKMPAQAIQFAYTTHGKPFLLLDNQSLLQFNLAHSNEVAVYAFTLNHPIGIDIEKIQNQYTPAVAKRYFTLQENEALMHLPNEKRASCFYSIWAKKEALIKALGKGLSITLSSFSVGLELTQQTVILENETWWLIPLDIQLDYASAIATNQHIREITYWRFMDKSYNLIKQLNFD